MIFIVKYGAKIAIKICEKDAYNMYLTENLCHLKLELVTVGIKIFIAGFTCLR